MKWLAAILEFLLPAIAFVVAYLGIRSEKTYDATKGGWWNRFTKDGKLLFVAALSTCIIAVTVKGLQLHNTYRQQAEEERGRVLAETEVRLALIDMTVPFRKAYNGSLPKPSPYLEPHVGYAIVPSKMDVKSDEVRSALYAIDLTASCAGCDQPTWGEYLRSRVRGSFDRLSHSPAMLGVPAQVRVLVFELYGTEFAKLLMDVENSITAYGHSLGSLAEPNDSYDNAYDAFWEILRGLDNVLALDKEQLAARGRMSEAEVAFWEAKAGN